MREGLRRPSLTTARIVSDSDSDGASSRVPLIVSPQNLAQSVRSPLRRGYDCADGQHHPRGDVFATPSEDGCPTAAAGSGAVPAGVDAVAEVE